MTRALAKSISQPTEDELTIIDKQYEFINAEFKFNIHDLETLINLLRTRLLAEELYIGALTKVKKVTSIYESEKTSTQDSHLTFQQAVKVYEASVYDLIENRQNVRDTLKKEIEKLVQEKEHEEMTRKTHKAKLSEANLNYMNFRNRDIVKLQKSYTHRCEELKNAQNIYQQQQCVHANEETNDGNKSSRNSSDTTRLSGDYNSPREIDGEQHNKKGMAGLFSQMRTMAVGNHVSPVDQNKQISKFAKMKKDITDADIEYRDGVLILETLRKKQRKAVEETNWQVKNTIKRKAESVKSSLLSIVLTEMECLRVETEKTTASYTAAMKVDSSKDIQIYSIQYQANGYTPPAPIRYESFYFEGKCREVLFGGSLESYAIEHNRPIPVIVIKCIEAIERMGGLQKEGIYRVSGRQSNIEQLKHHFELDEDKVVLDSRFDVFTIATVMKMFIRELKRPLFDFSVQSRLSYSKNMPQAQRFGLLESKLSNLSFAHRSTLHYLISHLSNVNFNSQTNKMNIQNLALIFTPVIFHDFNQTEEATSGEWSPEDLFEDLILYHEMLFPVAEENARTLNEAKLQKALNGESPYSQFSQSNLLYLSYSTPGAVPLKNMLLTQSMTSPLLPSDRQSENISPYPPKLTTIIGGPPSQRYESQLAQTYTSDINALPTSAPVDKTSFEHLNQRASTGNLKSSAFYPQGKTLANAPNPSFHRSTSDTIILQRGSSLSSHNFKNKTGLSRTSSYSNTIVRRDSSTPPIVMPLRRDSLRKSKENISLKHNQYQPELNLDSTLPPLNEDKTLG